MARTVYGDHQRFEETYLKVYPGYYVSQDLIPLYRKENHTNDV